MEEKKKAQKREFWKPDPQTFSVFRKGVKRLVPYGVMDPYAAYTYIRDGVAAEQTEKLRKCLDSASIKICKRTLFETAVFSGVYDYKSDDRLIKPSGYVCFDFNFVSVQKTKDILIGLEQYDTVLLFKSPSGHGVKWVVNNRSVFKHVDFYKVVGDYLRETYNLQPNMEAGNLSHGCLLPYDPEVYINPNYI